LAFAAIMAAPWTISCHKMPLVAPSGSAMTLVAETNVLPVNGETNIIAVILEGGIAVDGNSTSVTNGVGTPVHNGTLVTFTTTLGRVEPAEARTTAGRTTVKLIADGRSGTAKITAFSGAASSTVEVDIGAAGATRVAVTANPQSLPYIGGTTTISARVEDQQGNGLLGVPVSFSTTKGSLSATTVLTNEQGFALTTLYTTAEATVTASTGGSATSLNGTVLVTLSPAATIGITPPTSVMLGVPATFTITPGTTSAITGVTVDFGDGTTPVPLGRLTSATPVQHRFRYSGDAVVTVRAVDGENTPTTVSTVVAVSQMTITSVTALPSSTTAPKVGDTVTFQVTPATGASVDQYVWDFGDGTNATTQASVITHVYTSSGSKVATVKAYPAGSSEATTSLVAVDVKP
jgi:hypothetical protein